MSNLWKRKRLRLLVRLKGIVGYDRKTRRCTTRRGSTVYSDCGKTICELFAELREAQQAETHRHNRRRF